jgi:hypothetical protein
MMWGGSGDSFLWVFVMSVPTHARLPWPPNVNRTRITHDGLAREKELSNVVSDNSILLCIQLTWLRQDTRNQEIDERYISADLHELQRVAGFQDRTSFWAVSC